MKMGEAIQLYEASIKLEIRRLTVQKYISDIRLFCLALHDPEIYTITRQHIIDHFSLMMQLGWKHNSLFAKCCAYKNFFKYLKKSHIPALDPDEVPMIQKEFVPPRIATLEEYKKVLAIIPRRGLRHIRNKAIVLMLWDTGARNGELMSLDLKDIQPEPTPDGLYYAIIRTEKTRGVRPMRQIYWTKETNNALQKWIKTREEYLKTHNAVEPDALFVASTNSVSGKRLKNTAVDDVMRKYSTMAGIPTLNAHSFRHHKARYIIESGGSNADVMSILGHSRLESSRIYTVLFGKDLERCASKFMGEFTPVGKCV